MGHLFLSSILSVVAFIINGLFISILSKKNTTDLASVNGTTPAPLTTQPPTTATVAPAEEIPEPPEVEQHSSMTIFFILLVVGMIFNVFKTSSCYLYIKINKLTLMSLDYFGRIQWKF